MAVEAGRTIPYPSGNGTEGFPEWYGTILHPRREASEDTNLIYYAVL